jgi:pimeloyl-ACP methyl ester carboxylesterase
MRLVPWLLGGCIGLALPQAAQAESVSSALPAAVQGGGGAPLAILPAGCWDAAQSDRIEAALDSYFAASNDAERHRVYARALAFLPVGLSEAELVNMAQPPAVGPGVAHLQTQRQVLEGHGWFNLALPATYAPAHACALVVALHGANSDGDSLVPIINQSLTAGGAIVLYPTVSNAAEMWDAPEQRAGVLRLVEWVAHRYRIDFRRVTILGSAMGGMGVWSYATAHPELWNAGAAVASRPTLRQASDVERLHGVHVFALHGQLDAGSESFSPVESVRAVVSEMVKRGMDAQLLEVPGSGHNPPAAAWAPLLSWIISLPPKASSPRPLLLPAPGQSSLSALESDPLGLDSSDPALVLIRQDRTSEARRILSERILQDPSRLNYLYLALAWVPALAETIPPGATAKFFRTSRGWGASDEHAALGALQKAISADQDPSDPFITIAYLWAAKIHAKRFLLLVDHSATSWVTPYNAFASCIKASTTADPHNREASDLALEVLKRLPPALQRGGTMQQSGE